VIHFLYGFGVWLAGLLLAWFVPLCFAALVFLTYKMFKAMPKTKPMKMEPSSGQEVRWEDVAGADEAREEMQEIVEFLKDPKRFKKLGARVPKGVLLYGPPGTGKTLLAKAIATESGANFYFQSASSFVEMFVGVGSARIRRLFSEARKHQPSIIFIDELDAVGTARAGGSHNREHDQTLNQLLVELDGFEEADRLIIMAASNRLEDLDPALLRPGRFDRQIHVAVPDLNGRSEILEVHTRNKPLAEDVKLQRIARQTSGLTGADLANICNEAAIQAGRANRKEITSLDFNAAVDRVVAGLQQRKLITDKEKRVIAYHEAGHALLARLMSDDIHKVTIVPRGRALGFMMSLPEEDRYVLSKDELEDWLKVTLGGRAAEQIVFGRITNGAANDLERATAVARSMVFEWGMGTSTTSHQMRADNYSLSEETKRLRDQEQREITDQAYAEALQLVTAHRHHLDVLATALLEKETLERDEIDLLLKDLQPTSNASGQIGVELPRDPAAPVNGAPAKAATPTPTPNGTPPAGTHRREPVLHSSPPERDPKTSSST
jgi:cell division protease FtsH